MTRPNDTRPRYVPPSPLGEMERRVFVALLGMAVVIAGGALGFAVIERGWTILDCLYMAVMTVTTVGYMEVRPLSPSGRAFNIIFILLGVGAFLYAVTAVANYLIAGELGGLLDRRRMEKRVKAMRDHYIICGFGRMGQQVAREFRREGQAVLVVDREAAVLTGAGDAGFAVLKGDAGDDAVLRTAGVEHARGLVTVVDDDATNVLITLSAKALNPKLFVVSRSNQESTQSKLVTAGADRVLWPYGISGRRMAQMAIRPRVVEFLEFIMHDEELKLWMEEFTVALAAPLDGQTLGSAAVRTRTGANVVSIRSRGGELTVTPGKESRVQAGDTLIALGTREQLQALRGLTAGGVSNR